MECFEQHFLRYWHLIPFHVNAVVLVESFTKLGGFVTVPEMSLLAVRVQGHYGTGTGLA